MAAFSSRAKVNKAARALSRTERRLLERKERNIAKRKAKIPNTEKPTSNPNVVDIIRSFVQVGEGGLSSLFNKSQRLKNLFESLVPRLPGRNVSFTHHSLWMALGFRLPLVMAIAFLLTDENTSPYIIQCSLGPSMLPTIQFAGDIWVIETGAWGRAWRRIVGGQDEESLPDLSSSYKVGDLVIWENPETGKRSCKRIVGLEGDDINIYGEYNKMYNYRSDFGVVWPRKKDGAVDHIFGAYSVLNAEGEDNNVFKNSNDQGGRVEQLDTLVVPKQCVWVEGDCPLFSMDSRQYGPIHVSNLRGRLIFRLWPWNRNDLMNDEGNSYLSSCWISKKRPVPYSMIESYIGKRFNFYRIAASKSEDAPQ